LFEPADHFKLPNVGRVCVRIEIGQTSCVTLR
jgi:hypothetical protein